MQIRQKLTYQFVAIVAVILFLSSILVYLLSSNYREEDFYNRLLNKATITAKLLIKVEEIDGNLLKKIEKDSPINLPKEKIIIFNNNDEVIYNSNEYLDSNIHKSVIKKVRLQKELRYEKDGYELLGFLFTDNSDQFVVIVGAVDIHGLSKLQNLRIVMLVVFGISIVLIFISGWFYAGRAMHPILNVIDKVKEISITSLNLRIEEGNGQDEIAKLASTFNNMLSRLESAFKMQKNFIANASHEMRTPLTSISGQLEVVLMNERSNDEYKEVITSVLEDMKNLNTISNRLLLLAQASSETAETTFAKIRVDDLIWQSRSELTKRNKNYIIDTLFDSPLSDENKLTVLGNEQLVKTAIINLIDNGCKYSDNNKVTVKVKSNKKYLVLQFIDEGIGIEEEDKKHIFEPFHRGKNAIAIKGHGIGLSLVDRIISLHHGVLEYDSVLNKGTTFTIMLPYS